MATHHNFLFFFVFFSVFGLAGPLRAERQDSDKHARAADFESFESYYPRAKQFPAAVKPMADLIEEASKRLAANKKDEAREMFRQAIATGETLLKRINRAFTDEVYFLLGFAYEKIGEDTQALQAYEKSLALRPGNALAVFRRAALLHHQGNCQAALPLYREVLWHAPKLSGELHYLIGECLSKLGKTEEAAKEFELSHQQNPDYLPGLRQLVKAQSQLLEESSDPRQKAELQTSLTAALNTILKQAPKDREASVQLVGLLLAGSDPLYGSQKIARAEEIAESFAESSGFKDEIFVRYLFQAKLKRGKINDATKVLELAQRALPNSKVYQDCAKQLEIERRLEAQTAG